MNRKHLIRTAAPVIALALTAAACGSSSSSADKPASTSSSMGHATAASTKETVASATGAATLRATLTGLLTEHVQLAALATGAALRGDTAGYDQYAAALNGPTDSNTSDIVAAITSAYGKEVGTAFDGLWRSQKHIPAFVAYTQAVAKGDDMAKQAALADLTAYATTFGDTLHSVNSNLPADAVTAGIVEHAKTLTAVIDAQKAGDQAATFAALNTASMHMVDFAKTLAVATATKFPEKFDGDAASPASDLRSSLTAVLAAHVWLAADATGAALGGRQAEFEAAAAALNGPTNSNTSTLVSAIGSVYGSDVQTAFDGLWRSEKHIPAFVAYTQAVAKGDAAAAKKAIDDLTAYATTFGETLHTVNPHLARRRGHAGHRDARHIADGSHRRAEGGRPEGRSTAEDGSGPHVRHREPACRRHRAAVPGQVLTGLDRNRRPCPRLFSGGGIVVVGSPGRVVALAQSRASATLKPESGCSRARARASSAWLRSSSSSIAWLG